MRYQYRDLAFVECLLTFFENAVDKISAALGRRTMVIAAHNGAFQANTKCRSDTRKRTQSFGTVASTAGAASCNGKAGAVAIALSS